MTWVEQHAHARHWVFRELDRLIDQRSRTEHNEQLHHNRSEVRGPVRLRALLIPLLRRAGAR